MKQGDVYWYTFRAPDKRRPVLILTRTSAIPYLTGITVAQITTTIRETASEVLLIANLPSIARDVSDIGHYGTGDLEITVASAQDLEAAKEFINAAYQKVGG